MKQNKMLLFALAGLWVLVSGATEYGSSGSKAPLFIRPSQDTSLSAGETIFIIIGSGASTDSGGITLCSTDGSRTDSDTLTLHRFTDGTPGTSTGTGAGAQQSPAVLPVDTGGTAYRSYSDWTGDRSIDRAGKASRRFSVWPGSRSSGMRSTSLLRFSDGPGSRTIGIRGTTFSTVDL